MSGSAEEGRELGDAQAEGRSSPSDVVPAERGGRRSIASEGLFIVGVGASAGGLEALEEFFSQVPPSAGICYVVVQHLSPDFKSMMVELLGRHSPLRTVEIRDGDAPVADTIHLIPPNRLLTLVDGRFHLVVRGLQTHTINVFFASLAAAQGDQCAGVVLSGTGTDGTHGVRVIKEAGGLVFAQEPASAKFDGMPSSVISGGLVDFIGTPRAIADRLLRYVLTASPGASFEDQLPSQVGVGADGKAFAEILSLLRRHSRIDFNQYKSGTMRRRINRRMTLSGEGSLSDYWQVLRGDSAECDLLCRELLIGVTQFFRDPQLWSYLKESVLPQLLENADDRGGLRLWVAGCSTGEEAYTLAMLIEELLEAGGRRVNYRLFATDARRDSLRIARAGVFSVADSLAFPDGLCAKYFESRGDSLIARRSLRDAITFAPHDLLSDPPFTQLSLVSCRNLLIYLRPEAQRRVLSRFRLSLAGDAGYLVLGQSESVAEAGGQFVGHAQKLGVFVACGPPSTAGADLAASQPAARHLPTDRGARQTPGRTTEVFYEALVTRYAPPGVAVDANFNILQVFGNVSDFITVPPGRVTTSLLRMVPQPLSVLINSMGRKALSTGQEMRIQRANVSAAEGERTLSLRLTPVSDLPGVAFGMLVLFEIDKVAVPGEEGEGAGADGLDTAALQRIKELEDELFVARENLNSAVQDLESTNEELQSTNEELTASNEELQSTNEELQSVNEELYTVNSEYQQKINELEELNGDLENLLRVVDAGVLFLDERLNVRRFNQSATRLLPLRQEDVGRPLGEIAIQADYRSLTEDAAQVLRSSARHQATVLGHDGAWWNIGMRLFRSAQGAVGGVIVTLQEVSELKRSIALLEAATHAHECAERLLSYGYLRWDLSEGLVEISPGAQHLMNLDAGEHVLPKEQVLRLLREPARQALERAIEAAHRGAANAMAVDLDFAQERGRPLQAVIGPQVLVPEGHPVRVVSIVLPSSSPSGQPPTEAVP